MMNSASRRNLALSSFIGPEPQQQPLRHAIMLLLSPWCGCSEGPVAWCSAIRRKVLGKNVRRIIFTTEKSHVMQRSGHIFFNRVIKARGFSILLISSWLQSPKQNASPPVVLSGPGCQDVLETRERRTATCGFRVVLLRALVLPLQRSPHPGARVLRTADGHAAT